MRQQFKKYGEFDAAYTLAKAFNYANDDQIPFEYSPIDPTNLQREYGPTPNDQRHRLVLSGVANLPWKFHFSPLWTIASGVPMDIMLPDGSERVPTMQRNAGGREFHNARELNTFIAKTNAGGGVWVASENTYVMLPQVSDQARFNDSFNALDFRLDRTFTFGDRYSLKLMGEAFNIFHVTNILGTSNLNYSGYYNTLSPDRNNLDSLRALEVRSLMAGGVFGLGRAAGLPTRGAIQLLAQRACGFELSARRREQRRSILSQQTGASEPRLSLAAAIAVVTGESIALGIFLTPAAMAKLLGSPLLLAVVWLTMAIMAMCGALCYSELAVRFPESGGEYVYLRSSFGEIPAFLYGWMSAIVMYPGVAARWPWVRHLTSRR